MSPFQTRLRVGLVILVVFAPMAGLPLQTLFGDHFFNAYSSHPKVVVPILIGLSALLTTSSRFQEQLRHRYPTGWVRALFWLVATPLLGGMLYLFASGWVAATSRLLAREPVSVQVEVLRVERVESRRNPCLRQVRLQYRDSESRLCADSLLPGTEIRVGQTLQAAGWRSPLGFHLETLRLQPPS